MRVLLLSFCPLFVHAVLATSTLATLPNSTVSAAKADASGNIYIAGYQGATATTGDAFVAKLSPAGTVVYSTSFRGGAAAAIDIDATGAAYISGQTNSANFAVTSGAMQTSAQGVTGQGFAAKVDPQGKVVYATFLGGSALTEPGFSGVVVDSAGDVIISGQTIGGVFPITPGAPFNSPDDNSSFVLKLDPTGGKLLASVRGVGGRLALDSQGNVYVAGLQFGGSTHVPTSTGAFQSTYQLQACGGDAQVAFACSYQYVTKLNAGLTQIVYSTYLNGNYGASPSAISVDTQGNAFLAGTTNSPDFPTTPDAFQPIYVANAPAPPQTCLFFCVFPPPASGYVTKLNATGTGLIYSTYYSGTQDDSILFAAFTPTAIYLSGSAGSPDLPGFDGFPTQCLPQTYAARISADAMEVGGVRTAPGNILAFDAANNMLLAWTGSALVAFDPAAPLTPIGCILDSADLKPVTSVVPGELLSIFGVHVAGQAITPPAGQVATSLQGTSVTINGIASPLLYVSPQQINLQAPFEIAGAAQADITLASTRLNLSDSRTVAVGASNPTAFLAPTLLYSQGPFAACIVSGEVYNGGPIPLAFNADGSRNTCANLAAAGSVVRIFLAGLGVTSPSQATGAISPSPGQPLNLPLTVIGGVPASIVSAVAAPGSISGVWQVDIRMPPADTGAVPVSLAVGGIPVRDGNLTIWVK